jgi:hypothetical protein
MAHSVSLLNSKSEFDNFLFAPVGEDRKGTIISVLTAFARLDFDPWQQAADFARLPREAAKTRMAEMIALLPGMSPARSEPRAIAERLVALLPGPASPAASSGEAWLGLGQPTNFKSPSYIVSIVIFVTLGFASQFFTAGQQSAQPSNADQSHTAATLAPSAPVAGQSTAPAVPAAGTINADDQTRRDRIDLGSGKRSEQGAGTDSRPAASIAPPRRPLFGR